VLAQRYDHRGWERVRPPLVPLTPAQRDELRQRLAAIENT